MIILLSLVELEIALAEKETIERELEELQCKIREVSMQICLLP